MLLDLRLVLNMLSPEQVARIVLEARRRGLVDVAALTERLSRRGRGRPRRNTFEEVDAWLIVWANELFRSGHAPSAWAAITRVVEGAWAAWDDGTQGRRVAEVLIGNNIWRAPPGKTLSRHQVLGSCPKSITHRVLARLRPNKRFPISIVHGGRKVKLRLHFSPAPGRAAPLLLPGGDSVYSHLPIYKGLKARKPFRRKALVGKGKNC